MNTPIYSQKVMESAVEIAHTAGTYGYQTPNSRDMMADFITWAENFEKTPYEDEDWMELIDSFAVEMMTIEVTLGRASSHHFDRQELLSTNSFSLDQWLAIPNGQWVYIPKHGDRILSKGAFVELCKGDVQRAYRLFGLCDWQHPATLIASGEFAQILGAN